MRTLLFLPGRIENSPLVSLPRTFMVLGSAANLACKAACNSSMCTCPPTPSQGGYGVINPNSEGLTGPFPRQMLAAGDCETVLG